jgi:hypothetical protein
VSVAAKDEVGSGEADDALKSSRVGVGDRLRLRFLVVRGYRWDLNDGLVDEGSTGRANRGIL